jgi:putative ABC transport system permease protein
VLLADEPTGNLDTRSGAAVITVLRDLNADGTTVIVITHDAEIASTFPRRKVYLGGQWFTLVGILAPVALAPEIDTAALVGIPVATARLGFDGHPTTIYERSTDISVPAVRNLLPATADPANPEEVLVSRPSDALVARADATAAFGGLFLGLGAVSLLVGGVGIANVMVISVLERRSEIGLRRALGARRTHIATQFLAEALLLTSGGSVAGIIAGAAITAGYATHRGAAVVIPSTALLTALTASIGVGTIAGIYPAIRAASLAPTQAIRSV